MNFLQTLKDIDNSCCKEPPDRQHLLRALHLRLAETREHIVHKANGALAVEVFYVALTDTGREFVRSVEEAIKE